MKIIRPEIPPKQTATLIINNHEVTQFKEEIIECEINPDNVIKEDNNDTIEDLMNTVLKENNYIVEKTQKIQFYLTEKQYELWNQKGGEKWLKKMLAE